MSLLQKLKNVHLMCKKMEILKMGKKKEMRNFYSYVIAKPRSGAGSVAAFR
jgi:hypothetical protein